MYLKSKANGDLVEVLDLPALFDPFQAEVSGRMHAGEELGDQDAFRKTDLIFPSGESLPQCWTDSTYNLA